MTRVWSGDRDSDHTEGCGSKIRSLLLFTGPDGDASLFHPTESDVNASLPHPTGPDGDASLFHPTESDKDASLPHPTGPDEGASLPHSTGPDEDVSLPHPTGPDEDVFSSPSYGTGWGCFSPPIR